MVRLTEKKASGSWQAKGLPWERLKTGETITKETGQILYGCLCKLKDYEDFGMNPDQLERWKYGLEDMATHVCDKLCRHPLEVTDQEELDAICESCPVSALRSELVQKRRDHGTIDAMCRKCKWKADLCSKY